MATTAPPSSRSGNVFMVKELIWPTINYVPHNGQKLIHTADSRHKVAACGRRFGKSLLGGNELVPEALITHSRADDLREMGKRREFWIVGPEYSDSEKEFRVFYNALKRLEVPFDHPGTYNNPESGDMHVSLWRGAFQVHAMSAKYPSTLVGEGLSGVIMAEAAKLKERVWTKFIRPTLADDRGWSLHTSTPEGKNWFYRLWQRGQDPEHHQWNSWRMPSWINNVVFPDGRYDSEIVDMGADMSDERFNQEIGAEFTEFVGRVFKDFDEEVHVTDLKYDERYPVYAGIDYGWTNPFVWLIIQTDAFDNIYILAEYRAIHKDINDIAGELASYPITSKVVKMYPDPAGPGDTSVLEKRLRLKSSTATGGELKWRLELIRQRLQVGPQHAKPEDQKPKLFIDRSCKELIREMQDYRYPETKEEQSKENPEKPLDKDDHGPEALGRFMRGYFGAPGADGTNNRARVTKAKLGRRG
jgi:hypothetical protein